jgi:hypothetical protein
MLGYCTEHHHPVRAAKDQGAVAAQSARESTDESPPLPRRSPPLTTGVYGLDAPLAVGRRIAPAPGSEILRLGAIQ